MAEKELKPLSRITLQEADKFRVLRWRARTDLGFLCRDILNYKDVSDEIHGPLMSRLQKFPYPTDAQFRENDQIINGTWVYKPIKKITQLEGGRRLLILDSRGFLKSTINAKAHTIQWILNYPDIAIMILQSNLEKAEMVVGEIKNHFKFNDTFRLLFPEHCPTKNIDDFGTKGKFTTKARGRYVTRTEETVTGLSIDAGTAGIHVDLMKFSDIVEPSNVGTDEQMASVIQSFYMSHNLLVGPNYWIDVEGTRYSYGDAYGEIIKKHKETPEELKSWSIYARGCYVKDTGLEPNKFTPEELDLPDKIGPDGKPILTWHDPERGFTYEHFEAKRLDDPYVFSSQMQNSPKGGVGGRDIFPIDKEYPAHISRKAFKENVRISHYIATVDTAETANDRSNYSVITVAAFASDGRIYVNEIVRGKFLPHELVKLICDLPKLTRTPYSYGDKLVAIQIEETSFVRGLRVALDTYQHTTGIPLPIQMIKRDNKVAKIERIQNTLQPHYMSKRIIFLDDLTEWNNMITELRQFPKSQSDDIMDTLADLFQNKEWFGREFAKPTFEQYQADAWEKMLDIGLHPTLQNDGEQLKDNYFNRTGGL